MRTAEARVHGYQAHVRVYTEITQLRDQFGHQRLREGKYTAGQIDARWTDAIEADFTQWLQANIYKLLVGRPQIEEILKKRAR